MFRKLLIFSAILVVVVSVLPAKLMVSNYSDTGLPYISQDRMQKGTFTNSRTPGADLNWYIVITDEDVSLVVLYYGTLRAERTVSTDLPVFKVTAVDDRGETNVFTGTLYSDRIMIEEDWEFRSLMRDTSYMDLTLELVDGDLSYVFDRFSYEDFVGVYALTYGFTKQMKGMLPVEEAPVEEDLVVESPAEEEEVPVAEVSEDVPANDAVEPAEAEEEVSEEPLVLASVEETVSEEPKARVKAKRDKAVNPFITAEINGGYVIPLSGDGDIRAGVGVIGYPWHYGKLNIGFRGDVSAFTYGSDTVYSKIDASASFYVSYFFKLAEDMGLGLEAGVGFGYLMDRTDDDTSHGGFLRVPVGVSYSLANGFQVALECFIDAGTDSLDRLGDFDLDVSFTPALAVRYAF